MRGMIRLLLLFSLAGIFANIGSLLYAGQWDRAVGPARSVENATRDLRRRMERLSCNRYSVEQVIRLERVAGEMVNLLRIDSARPGEVRHLMSELEALHARVQSVVLIETNRRRDHTLRVQADHLARRVTELQLALRRVSIHPPDCRTGVGYPWYGQTEDRFDDRFDNRFDDRFDSRFDSRFDDDSHRLNYNFWPQDNLYYRSNPGSIGNFGGSSFGSSGNGFQGSIQTRSGRYSFSIGR